MAMFPRRATPPGPVMIGDTSLAERGVEDHPALRRLASMSGKKFARGPWGARPSLTRSAGGVEDLYSAGAVDELIALRALFMRMVTEGTTELSPSLFTSSGGVGAELGDQLDSVKVLKQFAAGATLVLQGLHRAWGRSAGSPAPWSATSATPLRPTPTSPPPPVAVSIPTMTSTTCSSCRLRGPSAGRSTNRSTPTRWPISRRRARTACGRSPANYGTGFPHRPQLVSPFQEVRDTSRPRNHHFDIHG